MRASVRQRKTYTRVILKSQQSLSLSANRQLSLKVRCPSRRNFALKQAEMLFTLQQRKECNCSGKKALDAEVLQEIKANAFTYWPLEGSEQREMAWKNCIRTID